MKRIIWSTILCLMLVLSELPCVQAETAQKIETTQEKENTQEKEQKISVLSTGTEAVEIDEYSEICLAAGTKKQCSFTPQYLPDTATDVKITKWKSANTKVATVSSKGLVKGISKGSTSITIEYSYTYQEYEYDYDYGDSDDDDDDYDYSDDDYDYSDDDYDYDYDYGDSDDDYDYGDSDDDYDYGDSDYDDYDSSYDDDDGYGSDDDYDSDVFKTMSYVQKTATDTVSFTVNVTNPKIKKNQVTLNTYGAGKYDGVYNTYAVIEMTGLHYDSEISWTASKNLLVESGWAGVYVYPKKKGTYTINFNVDGKKLPCKIKVVNAYFKRNSKSVCDLDDKKWVQGTSMLALYKGESTTLAVKGMSGKVKWTSSNKKVATVDSKGKVKAKGCGYATITAKADDISLTYEVGVSYTKAIKALRYAVKNYHSTYSQPKRMQTGYYDCSSYVWRSYKSAGIDVGNAKNYAPTASNLAQWCQKNGYVYYKGAVNTKKLLPGDLIFWTGEDNGRYQGIYHVDMYQGNNLSVTVARQKYFGGYDTNVIIARPCKKK